MPSANHASRLLGSGPRLSTNPPFAPLGTMTVFFTIWALTNPRISIRKSSCRSDQRIPPRATEAKRKCTPSTRGENTQISNFGSGKGKSGTNDGSNLKAMTST